MVVPSGATTEVRIASAAIRWAAAIRRQTRARQIVHASLWLLDSSRVTLERPRPRFRGGIDIPFPVTDSVVRARLCRLIDGGAIPRIVPRRMFVGPCVEDHECTACGVDIHKGEQEFEWTNPGGLMLYFHRRCVDIYRILNGRS